MASVFFGFVLPSEMWSFGATTTGTVDADYQPGWLTDAWPGRPVRSVTGGLSLDMTGAAGVVGIVAIHNHNLIVPVTIGGDVAATITPAATRPPNGIPLDACAIVTPAASGVDHLTFSVSGNDEDAIVGEFLAGQLRTMERGVRRQGGRSSKTDFAATGDGLQTSVPPYNQGQVQRVLSGSILAKTVEREVLEQWYDGQQGDTRPALIVLDLPTASDVRVVKMAGEFSYERAGPDLWDVAVTFLEYPRSRW